MFYDARGSIARFDIGLIREVIYVRTFGLPQKGNIMLPNIKFPDSMHNFN